MKAYSLVKYDGTLANPAKKQYELQNANLTRPTEEQHERNLQTTRQALNVSVSKKIEPAYCTSVAQKPQQDTKYVRYSANPTMNGRPQQSQQRIVQISTVQEDPLEPPRHKHKRIPRAAPSPPPQILRSPPRKLTSSDQQDWKIPPCISNWKNAKGYTIPLHMRLQADGRTLQDTSVNERFATFADSMYAAERQARKEVEERNKIQETVKLALAAKRERETREAATLVRAEKAGLIASSMSGLNSEVRKDGGTSSQSESELHHTGKKRSREERELEEAKKERDALRHQRKREIERDRRMEVAGKKNSKSMRDEERDVSEKIALGQAQPTSRETMFDQRLFNQTSGLDSGFGEEDDYNLYDKPLFTDRTAASIYKNVKEIPVDDEEVEVPNQKSGEEAKKSQQPNRGFEGTDYTKGARTKPVEFEKRTLESDSNEGKLGTGGIVKKTPQVDIGEANKRSKHD